MTHTRRCSRLSSLIVLLCALGLSPELCRADAVTDYNVAVQFYKQKRWDLAAEGCRDFLKQYPQHERASLARLYLAQALVHLQSFGPARDEFRTFLKAYPEHAERPLAMYRTGECSYFMEDMDSAQQELQAFVTAYPDNELTEWGLVYLGEAQFRLNKVDDAAKTFEAYLKKFDKGRLRDDAEFGLARAYEVQDRKADALKLYRDLAARPNSPRAADAQFNVGARLFDEGQYEQAAAAFAEVAERFPKSQLVSLSELNGGYALYHLKKFNDAISHFRNAAADQQQQETAEYWIGLAYKADNKYDEASKTFAAALEKNPDQPLAESLNFHWGHSELRAGHFKEALERFDEGARKWPTGDLADDCLYAACESALRAGDYAAAAQRHDQFVSSFPESGLRYVEQLLFGRLRIAQADALASDPQQQQERTKLLEEASAALSAVARDSQIRDTEVSARLQWARALERLGRHTDLITTLQPIFDDTASVEARDLEDARMLRGKAELQLKQFVAAAADFDAILKQSEVHDRLNAMAGKIAALGELKQWADVTSALEQFKTVDTKDTQYTRLSMRSADLAFADEAWPDALALFQRVLDQGPNTDYYVAALSGIGYTQYEQKQYEQSAASFEKVLNSGTTNQVLLSDATHLRALNLRLAEKKDEALALYQTGVEQFHLPESVAAPTEDELRVSMNAYRCAKGGARVARELGQRDVSDKLWDAAYHELKRQPAAIQVDMAPLINEWADLHYTAEDYTRSDELFRLLIQEQPDSELADDAKIILAESLRFSGKSAEAMKAFAELGADPKADQVVRQRAWIHLLDLQAQAGDWSSVKTTAETLQKDFPENSHQEYIAYRLGESQLKSGQFDAAQKSLDALRQQLSADISKAPEWWPEVWLLLAETALAQKQYPAVEGTLKDLQDRGPNTPLLYRGDLILGRSLENRAEFDLARAAYERVLSAKAAERTESAAEAQFRIAETFMKQKNYAEAFKAYYKVYVGHPFPEWQAYSLFQAGMCDKAQRNWQGAATTFETLIKEFPNSDSATKAQEQLTEVSKMLKPAN